MSEKKELFIIGVISAFVAGLCCFTPIILVLIGLGVGILGISFAPGQIVFASSLADILYGQFKWVFRSVGLVTLIAGMTIYYRRKGICTIDQIKVHRTKIINTFLLVFIASTIAYIVWLYIILHVIGVALSIWR